MTTHEVQKADPKARRLALVFLIVGAIIGTLLILALEQYQGTMRDRILSEPAGASDRIRLAFLLSAVLLSTPLLISAAYFWNLGAKVRRAQRFPPPNVRVIRDTPVVYGDDAALRGRVLQGLALGLLILTALLLAAFWYFAATLSGHAA
jgi:uncharacterized membrane protein